MAEYSGLIDQQISEILGFKGRVTTEQLPGLSAEDAAVCLRQYVLIHAHERALVFDGFALQWAAADAPHPGEPSTSPAPAGGSVASGPAPSPVDQVLAAESGPSLLDTARSEGPVSKGMWTLPVALGLPGGFLAWLLLRQEKPRTARNMLITGTVVQVLSIVLGFLIAPMLGGAGGASTPAATWQPSSSGLPTLYYFNRATSAEGREMTPVIDDLAREYAGRIDFVLYSDLGSDPRAAAFAQAQGIEREPAIVLVKSTGEEIERWTGVQPRDEIDVAIGNAAAR